VAWGYNGNGETNVPAPNSGFVAVAAGMHHSLGLKSDGAIVAWGGLTNVPAPNTNFVAVAAGRSHNLAIRASKADYNNDGFIDLTDYAALSNVLDLNEAAGPTVRFWFLFDMDEDRDVDLTDVALFEQVFNGP
jgi:hypothetical protein